MRLTLLLACLFIPYLRLPAQSPETLGIDLGNNISLPLVLVPKGGYMQGSPTDESLRGQDETQRFVHLSEDFYIGKTAVTVAQWERFVQETGYRTEAESGPSGGFGWAGDSLVQKKEYTWRNPGFPQTDEHPVTIITYPDAEAFCAWLTKKIRRKASLPTEAQWEYACRAGTTTAWHNLGDENASTSIAWHNKNAGNQTHPVISTTANPWGLHIGGNVAEWCQDWYAPYEPGPVTNPVQMNPNLSDKPRRVLRGGSWSRDPKNTRSAARFRADARSRNADIGFRVVCSVAQLASPAPPSAGADLLPRMDATSSGETSVGKPPEPEPPSVIRQHSHLDKAKEGPMDLFIGLLCLACPLIVLCLIIWVIIKAVKSSKTRAGTTAPPPISGRSAGATLAENLQRPGRTGGSSPRVRVVDDGFWLLMDVAHGALIRYTYRPEGGMEVSGQVAYQPGPEGHFVYTGARPENVSVTGGGTSFDDVTSSGFSSTNDQNDRFTASEPPRYPSAY